MEFDALTKKLYQENINWVYSIIKELDSKGIERKEKFIVDPYSFNEIVILGYYFMNLYIVSNMKKYDDDTRNEILKAIITGASSYNQAKLKSIYKVEIDLTKLVEQYNSLVRKTKAYSPNDGIKSFDTDSLVKLLSILNKQELEVFKEKVFYEENGLILDKFLRCEPLVTKAIDDKLYKIGKSELIILLKESISHNAQLNQNLNMTFNKISFDKNNILCVTGNNIINFWYIYNTIVGKIPFISSKNYNFIDHSFYKFRKDQKSRDDIDLKKYSVLITITSNNELYVLQSTQKVLESDSNVEFTDEINILSSYSGIEQFIIKFHITDIFKDVLCVSEKICILNTVFFNGLIIGNNSGDIVIYEKNKRDDISNFDYYFIKKFEKKENKSRCTSISTNFNSFLALITY